MVGTNPNPTHNPNVKLYTLYGLHIKVCGCLTIAPICRPVSNFAPKLEAHDDLECPCTVTKGPRSFPAWQGPCAESGCYKDMVCSSWSGRIWVVRVLTIVNEVLSIVHLAELTVSKMLTWCIVMRTYWMDLIQWPISPWKSIRPKDPWGETDFSFSVHLLDEAHFCLAAILQIFRIMNHFAGRVFVWNFSWVLEKRKCLWIVLWLFWLSKAT